MLLQPAGNSTACYAPTCAVAGSRVVACSRHGHLVYVITIVAAAVVVRVTRVVAGGATVVPWDRKAAAIRRVAVAGAGRRGGGRCSCGRGRCRGQGVGRMSRLRGLLRESQRRAVGAGTGGAACQGG